MPETFPTRPYYMNKSIQPWEAMKSWLTPEEYAGYLRGNIIKYLARYPDKGGMEDLQKAHHYLHQLITHFTPVL